MKVLYFTNPDINDSNLIPSIIEKSGDIVHPITIGAEDPGLYPQIRQQMRAQPSAHREGFAEQFGRGIARVDPLCEFQRTVGIPHPAVEWGTVAKNRGAEVHLDRSTQIARLSAR